MHSSSYQQQNNVSFCSTKQLLFLPFFFFQEQTNTKRTFAPSHMRILYFICIKKVCGSHRLYKLQGGNVCTHASMKRGNQTDQLCVFYRPDAGAQQGSRWADKEMKSRGHKRNDVMIEKKKKKKNSLSGKQFFHHRRLAAVTTKTKTINKTTQLCQNNLLVSSHNETRQQKSGYCSLDWFLLVKLKLSSR